MNRRTFVQTSAAGILSMNLTSLHNSLAANRKTERQPAIFIGHGSPMNIIRNNQFTKSLRELGKKHEKPTAVVVVSAHWLTRRDTKVSLNPKPETIYDFGGFPRELYAKKYPAPGSPENARKVISAVKSIKIHEDHDMGLDHGAWSILLHMWPDADVPVFQLSIDWSKPPEWHLALGKELASLRDHGVLILGSGNVTHNLSKISSEENDPNIVEWAAEFDAWAKAKLVNRDDKALADYESQGKAAKIAVASNDHYLPMLYTLGAMGEKETVKFTHESFQHGSISMRCFVSA